MLFILVMVLLIEQLQLFSHRGLCPSNSLNTITYKAHCRARTSAGCVHCPRDCLNKKKINLERAQREVQTQRMLSYLHLVVQRWNCAALKHHPVISEFDIHQSV